VLLGIVGLALITFAARLSHLQPGAISLLYLIVVVFVSLVGRNEEPASHRGHRCFPDYRLGDYRNGGASAQADGSAAQVAI